MTPCQEFDGPKDKDGYGILVIGNRRQGKKMVRANRLAWALHNGADPVGKVVMHTCDNPSCLNPEHLVLGTTKQNVADKYAKGRNVDLFGELNGMAKLTTQDILRIRESYACGVKQVTLCKEYGLASSHMSRICNNKSWRKN